MADQQSCAEKLYLVGEMIDTAEQYMKQCGAAMKCEDKSMVDLASAELVPVRGRCAQLSKDLAQLQKDLSEQSRKPR